MKILQHSRDSAATLESHGAMRTSVRLLIFELVNSIGLKI